MDLAAVMDEIADRLRTIDALQVFANPPSRPPTPPAAIVTYPETYTYDQSYGRGMDRMDLPVVLVVGKVDDLSARDAIAKWIDGSGADSIKTLLEAAEHTAFDTLRATQVEFDVITIGAVEYLAATITLDIAGSGA